MVGDFLHHRCHVGYHIVNLQHNWLSYRAELWKANDSYLLCFVGDGIGLGLAGWLGGVTLLQLLNHIWDEVPPKNG